MHTLAIIKNAAINISLYTYMRLNFKDITRGGITGSYTLLNQLFKYCDTYNIIIFYNKQRRLLEAGDNWLKGCSHPGPTLLTQGHTRTLQGISLGKLRS